MHAYQFIRPFEPFHKEMLGKLNDLIRSSFYENPKNIITLNLTETELIKYITSDSDNIDVHSFNKIIKSLEDSSDVKPFWNNCVTHTDWDAFEKMLEKQRNPTANNEKCLVVCYFVHNNKENLIVYNIEKYIYPILNYAY